MLIFNSVSKFLVFILLFDFEKDIFFKKTSLSKKGIVTRLFYKVFFVLGHYVSIFLSLSLLLKVDFGAICQVFRI